MTVRSASATPSFRRVLEELRAKPALDHADVSRALEVAQQDGALSPAEHKALTALADGATFTSDGARARLTALLALPDDALRTIALDVTRVDGRVDVRELDRLIATARGGTGGAAQLHALRIGAMLTRGAAAKLDDALAVDARAAKARARRDAQPLRTHVLDGRAGSEAVARATLKKVAPPARSTVTDVKASVLEGALATAKDARTARLAGGLEGALATTRARVVPEDGSLRVRAFHMGYGLGADQTGIEFPLQMARIGKLEGFELVLRVPVELADDVKRELAEEKLTNVTVMGIVGEGDFWSEDQGELDVDGNVRVPAPAPDIEKLTEAGYRDRLARYYPDAVAATSKMPWAKLREKLKDDYPDVLFAMAGAVADRKSHEVFAATAVGKGTELSASLTHLEGGNVLSGTLPSGEGYALVGKDSLAHSRVILEADLGRPITDDELLRCVANDLGIDAKNVVAVEQPRDFHLDMHMTPVKPGEILLNDVVAATKLQCQWELEDRVKDAPQDPGPSASPAKREAYESDLEFHRELLADLKERHAELMAGAEKMAAFEDKVARDLEQGGLVVHRAPAVFGTGYAARANFLNAEQGTNANGERYYIALGGDPRAEQVFLDALEQIDTGIARVHLLDRALSPTTLIAGGGISCRTKAEGTLAR